MSLKCDKLFITIITIVLVCAIAYPIWLGHNMSDENKIFSGVVGLYPGESFYYLALGPAEMADGQRVMGEDKFMRADKAIFINPIGNCIALISDLATWDNTTSFFLYRIFAAILLVISFVKLSNLFLSRLFFQLLALSLFIFGSGWDVCINSLGACSWSVTAPEMNPLIACIGEYYIPTATALFLFYLTQLLRLLRTSTPLSKDLFVSGTLLFILGAVYIYAMLIAISLTASLLLYYRLKKGSTTAGTVKIIVWNALFSLPVIIYYVWLYTNLNSTAQDVGWVMGPSLVETLLTNFWVAVPAILLVAFGLVKNDKRDDWMALAVWVSTVLIITRIPPPYLPFQVQAHIGLSAPLSIMTAVGLQRFYSSARISRFTKPLALSLSALVLFLSIQANWKFYAQMLNRIEQMTYPEFIDKDELKAFTWVGENLSQSATFAVVEEQARMLAGFTGCRVFYRNTQFEEFSETKEVLTTWSDAIGKGDAGCPSTLINHEISYVFVCPLFREKYLNPISIDNIPCSKCIYSSGKFSIWELNKVQ